MNYWMPGSQNVSQKKTENLSEESKSGKLESREGKFDVVITN